MGHKYVVENNPLPEGYYQEVLDKIERTVDWSTPGLKIIRMRFVSDPGYPYWDLVYCHGQMPNGEYVDVGLPFSQLMKRRNPINKQLAEFAKRDGFYLKPTGAFDAVSTLN